MFWTCGVLNMNVSFHTCRLTIYFRNVVVHGLTFNIDLHMTNMDPLLLAVNQHQKAYQLVQKLHGFQQRINDDYGWALLVANLSKKNYMYSGVLL